MGAGVTLTLILALTLALNLTLTVALILPLMLPRARVPRKGTDGTAWDADLGAGLRSGGDRRHHSPR